MAVIHGVREKLIGFSLQEQPLALQLGGSDPALSAQAAAIGEDWGYSEINLNVGCPSDRVQGGNFGACLMATPQLVAHCVAAMQAAVHIPVTVKCRIGIDDQDAESDFQNFIDVVTGAGCKTFIVHARKAWLHGLSPKQNREIPPLDHDRVKRLKSSRPGLLIVLNGGLLDPVADSSVHGTLDGFMYGREAYHNPWKLTVIDPLVAGEASPVSSRAEAVMAMRTYVDAHLARGHSLHNITRHMLGLYHAQPGGRLWRQVLSTEAVKPGADFSVLQKALAMVEEQTQRRLAAE